MEADGFRLRVIVMDDGLQTLTTSCDIAFGNASLASLVSENVELRARVETLESNYTRDIDELKTQMQHVLRTIAPITSPPVSPPLLPSSPPFSHPHGYLIRVQTAAWTQFP